MNTTNLIISLVFMSGIKYQIFTVSGDMTWKSRSNVLEAVVNEYFTLSFSIGNYWLVTMHVCISHISHCIQTIAAKIRADVSNQ